MRSHRRFPRWVLGAALCASWLVVLPVAAAERGDSGSRGSAKPAGSVSSVATSLRSPAAGPVRLFRLLREPQVARRLLRFLEEEPPVDPGFGLNGLSDDPDPTGNKGPGVLSSSTKDGSSRGGSITQVPTSVTSVD